MRPRPPFCRPARDGRRCRPFRPCGTLALIFLLLPSRRSRVVPLAGGRRHARQVPRPLRHLRRAGRAHRPLLDGAHPAGEDRAQAPPSAVRGDSHAVPAVARLRRPAVAAGLDLGLLEAGHAQAGVRHRQARCRTRNVPRGDADCSRARACASGWRASRRRGSRTPT